MKPDTRHWNLFAGALLAATACRGAAPAEEDDSDSWADGYCGGEPGESAAWRCSTDDADYYDDEYGDEYGDEHGEECFPSDCDFGEECGPHDTCVPVPAIPPCEPSFAVTSIPLDNLPFGILQTVQREENPEVVLVAQQSIWRFGEGTTEHPRQNPAHFPTDVDVVDLDGDGELELTVADQASVVVHMELDEYEETVLPFATRTLAWGTIEDPTPSFFAAIGDTSQILRPSGMDSWTPFAATPSDGLTDTVIGIRRFGLLEEGVFIDSTDNRSRLMGLGLDDGQFGLQTYDDGPFRFQTASIDDLFSPVPGDMTYVTSDGTRSKVQFFIGADWFVSIEAVLDGRLTSHPPLAIHGPDTPRVLLMGAESSALLLVDPAFGVLCEQPLPPFRTATAADMDLDGVDELFVQELDGTVARLVVE